jgi:hypothetical protein
MRNACSSACSQCRQARGHERPRFHQRVRHRPGRNTSRSRRTWASTGSSRVWYLKKFDAYCTGHDRTVFDRDTVEGWVSIQLERSGRYRSWMSYIRDFGRWLRVHGSESAYVLSDQWKAPFVPAHPYLLSQPGD